MSRSTTVRDGYEKGWTTHVTAAALIRRVRLVSIRRPQLRSAVRHKSAYANIYRTLQSGYQAGFADGERYEATAAAIAGSRGRSGPLTVLNCPDCTREVSRRQLAHRQLPFKRQSRGRCCR